MFAAEEILTEIAESTRPRQVEKDVAQFNPRVQPTRRGGRERTDTYERFMSKVDKSAGPDGCWIWNGGSARFHVASDGKRGRKYGVMVEFRRYAWEQAHGSAPDGKLFASCRNTRCCNPAHLSTKHPGFIPGSRYSMTDATFIHRKRLPVPEAGRLAVVPTPSNVAESSASAILAACIDSLEGLNGGERARVLRAIDAWFR